MISDAFGGFCGCECGEDVCVVCMYESFLFGLVPVVGFGYIGVPGVMMAGV
jgi:hypothetical protein